jgi:hypothetical protein
VQGDRRFFKQQALPAQKEPTNPVKPTTQTSAKQQLTHKKPNKPFYAKLYNSAERFGF